MLKKLNLTSLGVIVVVIVALAWNIGSFSKADSFSVATITYSMKALTKKKYRYSFHAETKLIKGSSQSNLLPKANEGEKYIVVYQSSNPGNNSVIYDLPYTGEAQLDSLKRNCNPQDLIKFYNY